MTESENVVTLLRFHDWQRKIDLGSGYSWRYKGGQTWPWWQIRRPVPECLQQPRQGWEGSPLRKWWWSKGEVRFEKYFRDSITRQETDTFKDEREERMEWAWGLQRQDWVVNPLTRMKIQKKVWEEEFHSLHLVYGATVGHSHRIRCSVEHTRMDVQMAEEARDLDLAPSACRGW